MATTEFCAASISTVHAGEIVAVLGANGAGKSTLNKALSGVHPAVARRHPVRRRGDRRPSARRHRRAGPHSCAGGAARSFPNMTVRENLELGAYRRGRARRDDNRDRVFAVFPRLASGWQRAGTLSGGEQQMLAIGRGLMAEPQLLILDEPSLGLSPRLVEELFALITAIHARGAAVLLVEQNVVQSLQVAQRAYIVDNGRFVLEGPAADIADNSDLRRAYLGM